MNSSSSSSSESFWKSTTKHQTNDLRQMRVSRRTRAVLHTSQWPSCVNHRHHSFIHNSWISSLSSSWSQISTLVVWKSSHSFSRRQYRWCVEMFSISERVINDLETTPHTKLLFFKLSLLFLIRMWIVLCCRNSSSQSAELSSRASAAQQHHHELDSTAEP